MPAEKSSTASSTRNQPPSTKSPAVRRSARQRRRTARSSASIPISASGTIQPAWSPRPVPKMRQGLRAPPKAIASVGRCRPVGLGAAGCGAAGARRRGLAALRGEVASLGRRRRHVDPGAHQRVELRPGEVDLRRATGSALLPADAPEAVVAELQLELRVVDAAADVGALRGGREVDRERPRDRRPRRAPHRRRRAARSAAAASPARRRGSRGRSPARTEAPRATSC